MTAVAIDAAGGSALTAAGGWLRRWDLVGEAPTAEAATRAGEEVTALALDESGAVALSAAADGSVCGWAVQPLSISRQPHTALPPWTAGASSVRALALSEGGLALALGANGSLRQWAWAGGAQTLAAAPAPLILPDGAAALGAAALAGELVLGGAAAAADVYVWKRSRLGACELLHTYAGHRGGGGGAAVEAVGACEGAALGASAAGGAVHLWGLRDGAPRATLDSGGCWAISALALRGGSPPHRRRRRRRRAHLAPRRGGGDGGGGGGGGPRRRRPRRRRRRRRGGIFSFLQKKRPGRSLSLSRRRRWWRATTPTRRRRRRRSTRSSSSCSARRRR